MAKEFEMPAPVQPPDFVRRENGGERERATRAPTQDDLDMRAAAALNRSGPEAYAKRPAPQRQEPPPLPPPSTGGSGGSMGIGLADLERVLSSPPLGGVSIAISELKFHDHMQMAIEIKSLSEVFASIEPYQIAAALSAWALRTRADDEQSRK